VARGLGVLGPPRPLATTGVTSAQGPITGMEWSRGRGIGEGALKLQGWTLTDEFAGMDNDGRIFARYKLSNVGLYAAEAYHIQY